MRLGTTIQKTKTPAVAVFVSGLTTVGVFLLHFDRPERYAHFFLFPRWVLLYLARFGLFAGPAWRLGCGAFLLALLFCRAFILASHRERSFLHKQISPVRCVSFFKAKAAPAFLKG
ncbi:hypothetical protein ES703_13573 [subsurface metagenome]